MMNKSNIIIAVALACSGLAANATIQAHRAPSKGAHEQRVIDETAAQAGLAIDAATRTAASGFTVVDRPYDAPLPISPVGGQASKAAPTSGFPVRPAAPAAAQAFRVESADGTLSRALRRWGREAHYPVIWEASRDLPAVTAVYGGDFPAAINQVMKDSSEGGYPLHACLYDNVVRVLHTSQSCTR